MIESRNWSSFCVYDLIRIKKRKNIAGFLAICYNNIRLGEEGVNYEYRNDCA